MPGYHRNNWRQAAGAVANFLGEGHDVLAVADSIKKYTDERAISRMNYVDNGHPIVELPWDPPGGPPDPRAVEYVHGQVGAVLFDDPARFGARAMLDRVATLLGPLRPADLDQVVRRLGPEGLLRWDELMHHTNHEGEDEPYSGDDQQRLFNWLLSAISPYGTMLVGDSMPCSQPPYTDCCGNSGWVLPEGPFAQVDGRYLTENWQLVAASSDAMSWQDMDQGRFGTCWLLTTMQAVIQANPQHAARHLRLAPNGTVTLTVYDEGQPYDVTVVADLPFAHGALYCAKGHTKDARYAETWPGYFEKAVAQFRGSYANVDGGWGYDALALLTGKPVERLDPRDPWVIHTLADRRARGGAAVVGTIGEGNDRDTLMNGRLATSHEYFVKDIDVPGRRICIGNPWGDDAEREMWQAWITADEIPRYLDEVSVAPTW